MTDRIPELRLYDILIDSTCDTYGIDPAGAAPHAVATITQSSALPVNPGDPAVWRSIIELATGAGAYGAVDAEEAGTAAGLTAPTFAYNSSGDDRGKFTFADTVAFILDDNSEGLLELFGFTEASYASALSHTSDWPSPYIFTPAYGLKDAEDFPWTVGGSWLQQSCGSSELVTDGGATITRSGYRAVGTRRITFTLLSDYDVWWFGEFWELARTGRRIRFMQDRTEGNAFSKTYPFGYLDCVLDGQSKASRPQAIRTFPGRPGKFDITIGLREYVELT